MRRQIAVVGPSQSTNETDNIAFDVGSELARRGAVLVCGGLTGVMEAAYVDHAIPTGMGEARNALVVKSGELWRWAAHTGRSLK